MTNTAAALAVSPGELDELRAWLRSSLVPAGLAQRARIITLAAQGVPNTEIAELVGCSRQTVITWRRRFASRGLDGLRDRHRPGRPPRVDTHKRLEIVAATLSPPPTTLGVTHWSSRLLAAELGVSNFTVARVWREYNLKPWQIQTFKFSDRCFDRHRHTEFLAFCKQVARAYPRRELHLVLDNYATHNHPKVRAWLQQHPRVHLHFTPTSASWMNLVEVFFGILTRQAIRRGSFASVAKLIAAIRRFVDAWNARCQPFAWTKATEQVVAKARRTAKQSAARAKP